MTNPLFSVVIATEDDAVGLELALALQPIVGVHVVVLTTGEDLAAAVREHDAMVVVGDASLVAAGAQDVERVRAAGIAVGFVIVAEQPSLADAVLALRARVDELFPGPVLDARLRAAVEDVAASVRDRREGDVGRTVLVVGATLDAVLLGAGGTIRMHADVGDRVIVATLDDLDDPARRAAAGVVAEHLGATIVPLACDGGSQEAISTALAPIVATHRPAVVLTHAAADETSTQRRVLRAVTEAAPDASRISCFQSAASSIEFAPTRFVDVDEVLERKVAAFTAWSDDASAVDLVRATATYWSRFGTGRACEPFELLRDVVQPSRPARGDDERSRVSAPMHRA